MPPIRSPRRVYRIEQIRENLDDNPDAIDQGQDETLLGETRFIFAKIKEGVGDWLGMEPVPFNDPIFTGTFGGNGLNQGTLYRRRLGGFRVASYTLLPYGVFNIKESYYSPSTGLPVEGIGQFKSMTIGLPKGHSVWEVITWLGQIGKIPEIRALVTPNGRRIDLYQGNAPQ